MARIYITDKLKKKQGKNPTIETLKGQLRENRKAKLDACQAAIATILSGTDYEQKNPPDYGFEEDTDPD